MSSDGSIRSSRYRRPTLTLSPGRWLRPSSDLTNGHNDTLTASSRGKSGHDAPQERLIATLLQHGRLSLLTAREEAIRGWQLYSLELRGQMREMHRQRLDLRVNVSMLEFDLDSPR